MLYHYQQFKYRTILFHNRGVKQNRKCSSASHGLWMSRRVQVSQVVSISVKISNWQAWMSLCGAWRLLCATSFHELYMLATVHSLGARITSPVWWPARKWWCSWRAHLTSQNVVSVTPSVKFWNSMVLKNSIRSMFSTMTALDRVNMCCMKPCLHGPLQRLRRKKIK